MTAAGIPVRRDVTVVWVFGATLFTSAFLLFWIQPLFAKFMLPFLGGTPAVWTTAMVFFQAVLLAAYGYAHWSCRALPPAVQIGLHGLVMVGALAFLPFATAWRYDPAWHPALQLLAVLTVAIGLPFFAVSATAPLLQRWFSRSGHADAGDPYFLYGASNLGSVLALLAFPFVMEPAFRLGEQNLFWSWGFYGLIALVAASATFSMRRGSVLTRPAAAFPVAGQRVSWLDRARWTILALAPSSLMLGVTAHISIDVAPIPLLWALPLALYLLTFVIAFSRRSALALRLAYLAAPYAVAILLVIFSVPVTSVLLSLSSHLLMFFLLALVCHGELVCRRPPVEHLTEFYFFMSLGGVLGGLFNGALAPAIFTGVYEYPIAIALAAALRPGSVGGARAAWARDLAWPAAVLAAGLLFAYVAHRFGFGAAARYVIAAYLAVIAIAVFGMKHRPIRYGLGVLAAFIAISDLGGEPNIHQERSFFGVYRVKESKDGLFRTLVSGTTTHGIQFRDPAQWREPLSYFSKQGPLGQLFAALRAQGRPSARVGLVGLGIGSALCYARPGEKWTVFEIDPLVVRLAQDTRYFRHWSECTDKDNTILRLGDARLTLAREPAASFDFLILDAYNSDAIPLHLMTREALTLYLAKLAPGGVLAVHISNRHLDLGRVLAGLAAEAGLLARIQLHSHAGMEKSGITPSHWVVLARDRDALAAIAGGEAWQALSPRARTVVWTDDYSNLLSVLR